MLKADTELRPLARPSAVRPLAAPLTAEPRLPRWLFHAVALAVAFGYAFFLYTYFAPAPSRPGIDENAYLLAGRNIIERGSPGFRAPDDYSYVGSMWVRTFETTAEPPAWLPRFIARPLTAHIEPGWYYPKYPAGIPMLHAIVMKLTGGANSFHAAEAALAVSPICAGLAVLGMFYLA